MQLPGGVITTGVISQVTPLLTGPQTRVPGLEERRAVPGPHTPWPAQDSLLRLAWHALPWLAPLALLLELGGACAAGVA